MPNISSLYTLAICLRITRYVRAAYFSLSKNVMHPWRMQMRWFFRSQLGQQRVTRIYHAPYTYILTDLFKWINKDITTHRFSYKTESPFHQTDRIGIPEGLPCFDRIIYNISTARTRPFCHLARFEIPEGFPSFDRWVIYSLFTARTRPVCPSDGIRIPQTLPSFGSWVIYNLSPARTRPVCPFQKWTIIQILQNSCHPTGWRPTCLPSHRPADLHACHPMGLPTISLPSHRHTDPQTTKVEFAKSQDRMGALGDSEEQGPNPIGPLHNQLL